ncbi:unnamed protein product [Pleuronectes platessa]|uniref:Uncharacterized protein n=1 Tax=Pleuronectes platessa TaxID=8262 RepID=A0A9N7US52_PLEPL|nr:unnamed protein product [Pleuronectes platessa]
MTCQAVPAAITVHAQQPARTTIHHPDQTPLQSSVTVHRRPPGPITSHHRGPGPPPVPNANATQGPPPAPRSAHITQNPPHWIQHRDPRCAIHKPQSMVRPQRPWICGLITAEVCDIISNVRRFGGASASGVNLA